MTATLIKPKAILFDWDNTLADTWPVIYASLKRTFEEMGKTPWTFEETKDRVHRSLRDSFPEIFGDRWEEAGKLYLQNFEQIHLERLQPLEGAKMVLDMLKATDIYLAVVSNKTGYNLRAEIIHLGWEHYFSAMVGAKDTDEDKPSPKPVLKALEGSNIELGDHIWFIGDSLTDLECAYNTGCTPIFYGDQDLTLPKFQDYQPAKHVLDHQALFSTLQEIVAA
jgi:phosphoglycolate phosphatase